MRDIDLRTALRASLLEEHANKIASTRFVDELELCGLARVDVAVINGSLAGFELKSQRDNLRRLPNQVQLYSRVLDFATLVVAETHLAHARERLPAWWGCIVARWDGTTVELESLSEAQQNPGPDPYSVALMLWRDEALDELDGLGLAKGRRGWTRNELCAALAAELPLEALRRTVRTRLKARASWRSVQ